ncbi:MAG: hypothetical protein QM528_06945 [Phycisphaerales bacterium]|nr:hypothetical protein [Phycisphaerales bacterium]
MRTYAKRPQRNGVAKKHERSGYRKWATANISKKASSGDATIVKVKPSNT